MRSPSLIYLITRIHGLSTHLISDIDIDSMIKAPSFESLIDLLLRTDYGIHISSISKEELTVYNIERIFASIYSERIYYPIRFTGGAVKKFMINYARRIEVENIKRVLRAKFGGAKININNLIPVPREYQEINFAAMVEAPTIEAAIDYITVSIYTGAYQYLTVSKEVDSLIPLELYVENRYYEVLSKVCRDVPDAKDVIDAINVEADIKNIYYIIGLKLLDVSSEILSPTLATIKIGKLRDFIDEFIRLKVDMIIDRLSVSPYGWVVDYIRDAVNKKDLDGVRIGCKRALRYYYNRIKTTKPLNFAFVLAYFSNVEDEYINLRAIVHGKYLQVKDEEINKLIIK